MTPVATAPNVTEVPTGGDILITTKNNQVRVQNAEGLTLDLYNVAGVKVATYRVDSDDKTITLNLNRGIYIAKVGKVLLSLFAEHYRSIRVASSSMA